MVRGLQFCIKEVEELYSQCSENKGADQIAKLICAFVFACAKIRFSHDVAQIRMVSDDNAENKLYNFSIKSYVWDIN